MIKIKLIELQECYEKRCKIQKYRWI